MTLAEVQESAMELSSSERAELLDWLWDGLQPRGVLELQERWAAEAEERIDAVDRGDLQTVDGPTAFEELRRSSGA
ncbi:MAG: addiction module protein [Verrucomicrobiales bacterium]|nr:addiction module protein [Verrucomicrobiales bacterium]